MAQTETRRGYEFDFSDARIEDLPEHEPGHTPFNPGHGEDPDILALHDPVELEDPLERVEHARDGAGTLVFRHENTFALKSEVHAGSKGGWPPGWVKGLKGKGDYTSFGEYEQFLTHPDGFSMYVQSISRGLSKANSGIGVMTFARQVADFEPVVSRYGEAMEGMINARYDEPPAGEVIRHVEPGE